MAGLRSLPTEILDLIAQFLSYGDLDNLTETCQFFRLRTFNTLDPSRKKYKSITTTQAGDGDVPFVEFLTDALRNGVGEMSRCLTVVSPFIGHMTGNRSVNDKGFDDLKTQLYGDNSASDGPLPHICELCKFMPWNRFIHFSAHPHPTFPADEICRYLTRVESYDTVSLALPLLSRLQILRLPDHSDEIARYVKRVLLHPELNHGGQQPLSSVAEIHWEPTKTHGDFDSETNMEHVAVLLALPALRKAVITRPYCWRSLDKMWLEGLPKSRARVVYIVNSELSEVNGQHLVEGLAGPCDVFCTPRALHTMVRRASGRTFWHASKAVEGIQYTIRRNNGTGAFPRWATDELERLDPRLRQYENGNVQDLSETTGELESKNLHEYQSNLPTRIYPFQIRLDPGRHACPLLCTVRHVAPNHTAPSYA